MSDIMAQAMEAMEEADRIDGETYALAEAMMLGEAMDPDRCVFIKYFSLIFSLYSL